MITTVSFDAGQTLIELDTAMLAARLAERGVVAHPAALAAAQPAAWQHYERVVRAGGHAQPWQGFMAQLIATAAGVDGARADALAAWLWTEQPARNLWRRPVPGMRALVRDLRAAGVAVGVLSNSEGRLAELFAEIGWADEFAAVIDSGKVGVDKPDPRIFALTLAALGGAPATAVHVGDSRSADVDGARAAGWRAIWFGPTAAATPSAAAADVAIAADAAGVRAALTAWGVAGVSDPSARA
ncbi:MAG: HAD family hydrolase [Myxococcales bacterium]|nr:HAD family hydrolase [Myxococcales bacterium]